MSLLDDLLDDLGDDEPQQDDGAGDPPSLFGSLPSSKTASSSPAPTRRLCDLGGCAGADVPTASRIGSAAS